MAYVYHMATRLYIAESISPGAFVSLDEARAHYVRHVMRLGNGDRVAVFNAESGEWEAAVHMSGKRSVQLLVGKQLAAPHPCPDVWLAFAAIKNKSELVVEKATELGVREIHPIVTQHSVVKNINIEKLRAHAIEAAEQCERHDVPTIVPHKNLGSFLDTFPKDRTLLYGDESGNGKPLPEALDGIGGKKTAMLIGPEGGFSEEEKSRLRALPFVRPLSLGPRILRAETAALAAVVLWQSAVGDWA